MKIKQKCKAKLCKSLAFLLVTALLLPVGYTNQVVYAATNIEDESGNESETPTPTVIVYNENQLVQAIEAAEDGEVIGIASNIEIDSDTDVYNISDKLITIMRMSEGAFISIQASASIIMRNIIFDGNSTVYNKGYTPMVEAYGKAEFRNVTFQNCCNLWEGGAIQARENEIIITECFFNNNFGSNGGHIAIFNGSAAISDSIFTNGVAESGGGAVYVDTSSDAIVEIEKCRIIGNHAKYGGAIANKGNIRMTESVVYGNAAEMAGEYLNYNGSSFQTESLDELSVIYKSEGIRPLKWVYDYDGITYIGGSKPSSSFYGAVKLKYQIIQESIDNGESNKEVVESYADLLSAIEKAQDGDKIRIGDIISVTEDNAVLGDDEKKVTIIRDSSISGIEVLGENVTVKNIVFDGNGEKYPNNSSPMLTIKNSAEIRNAEIRNCYCGSYGAGIRITGGNVNISNSIFYNNTAREAAHIAIVKAENVSITNTAFKDGKAEKYAGAISIASGYNTDILIQDCIITGNHAGVYGGGISNRGNLTLERTVIYGNNAQYGADISSSPGYEIRIDSLEDMKESYKSFSILPTAWVSDDIHETEENRVAIFGTDVYFKLLYEDVPDDNNQNQDSDDKDDTDDGNNSSNVTDSDANDDSGNEENTSGDSTESNNNTPDTGGDTGNENQNQDEDSHTGDDSNSQEDSGNQNESNEQGNQDNSDSESNQSGNNSSSGDSDLDTGNGNGNSTDNNNNSSDNTNNTDGSNESGNQNQNQNTSSNDGNNSSGNEGGTAADSGNNTGGNSGVDTGNNSGTDGGNPPASTDIPQNTDIPSNNEGGSSTDNNNTNNNNASGNEGTNENSDSGNNADTGNSGSGSNDGNTPNNNSGEKEQEETGDSPEKNQSKPKGTIIKSGKLSYRVTNSGISPEVAFTGSKSTSKTLDIPASIKIDGITYKVTSIAANALKNNKKVTKIVVGSNIKSIGKSAFHGCKKLTSVDIGKSVMTIGAKSFYGCKKLSKITIKSSKLKSVGKQAFKGIKSTAKIKVPSKKLKVYKKLLKNKGQGNKVNITK